MTDDDTFTLTIEDCDQNDMVMLGGVITMGLKQATLLGREDDVRDFMGLMQRLALGNPEQTREMLLSPDGPAVRLVGSEKDEMLAELDLDYVDGEFVDVREEGTTIPINDEEEE